PPPAVVIRFYDRGYRPSHHCSDARRHRRRYDRRQALKTGRRDKTIAMYAPTNNSSARKSSPPRKLPVTSRTMPIVYGATKPATAPSELMSAIPPAAASSVRKSEGSAQKGP